MMYINFIFLPVFLWLGQQKRPQYTVFGDAVNAAARMETTSERMKIQCSEMSYRLLRDAPNYQFSLLERGDVEVKGKGRYVVTMSNLPLTVHKVFLLWPLLFVA